ncbi:hypothetical protein MUG78_16940 [Gordonia alkaliphila]|uniref:hypothetical protein n=1 Tax=Gordonia alkaliphila TaxID=1053547 RepID=UPI001FF0F427|nr:hypothetical protein [Gordonia alkaliphila]MCK0441088.1 hypothetical protein [Gordonia alkaliphila]
MTSELRPAQRRFRTRRRRATWPLPSFDFSNFGNIAGIDGILASLTVGAFNTPIPGVTTHGWSPTTSSD